FRQAIKLDDSNSETYYSYGLALNKLNKTDEEILAYRRAVTIRPDHANALERLGQGYSKKKRWADAAKIFEQLQIYRPDSKTYNALGESLFELDRFEEALTAFNTALGYNAD